MEVQEGCTLSLLKRLIAHSHGHSLYVQAYADDELVLVTGRFWNIIACK